MQNFFYDIPTKVAFGKGQIEKLPEFIKEYGSRVLMVYGGGSIKRSGLYTIITALLEKNDITYYELSGVEPNPKVTSVDKGAALCKEHHIEVILPIGGGSTIDCGKAISAAAFYNGPAWDLVMDNSKVTETLPIIAIPTMAATGSEMDYFSVISNMETNDKMDLNSHSFYPKYSILDPEYTYSVSTYQTASGTADIMSHIFEIYFNGVPGTYFQERIMEGLLRTCVHFGPIACKKPYDYDARANLMWTSEWAINGLISCGKSGPWPCHAMEHQLSAFYDVTHGHGLAILTPAWMKYTLCEKTLPLFVNYGTSVFGISPSLDDYTIAETAIEKTKELFVEMGLSTTLKELGIPDKTKFQIMAEKAVADGLEHCLYPLTTDDVIAIFESCYE